MRRGFPGFTRGDAPTLSSTPASELAHRAADLVRHRFENAQVALQVDDGACNGARVLCDPTLFGFVLVNALVNALEASEVESSVRMAIRRSDKSVEFSIVDQGQGLALSANPCVSSPRAMFIRKRS